MPVHVCACFSHVLVCACVQNFLYKMLEDRNGTAAKCSLDVLVKLYRKKVWEDNKTVNVMAAACFSAESKVRATALNFFLGIDDEQMAKLDEDSDDEDLLDDLEVKQAAGVDALGSVYVAGSFSDSASFGTIGLNATLKTFDAMVLKLSSDGTFTAGAAAGGSGIDVTDAPDHVFGYSVGIDLTRRDLQARAKQKGGPWDLAKGFEQAAPIGEIRAVAEIGHPAAGRIWLAVNDEILMRDAHRLADLSKQLNPVLDPDSIGIAEAVERLALDVLEDHIERAVLSHRSRIDQPNDVRMPKLTDELHFPPKT